MKLVADRFIEDDRGRTFDAATGRRVRIVHSAGGGREVRAGWAVRCDTIHSLWHRAIAPLIDFGDLGVDQWFEAWEGADEWRGSSDEEDRMQSSAARFLCSIGAAVPDRCVAHVLAGPAGGPAIVPVGGWKRGANVPTPSDLTVADLGVAPPLTALVSALAPMFAPESGVRPRIIAVWGLPGSGRSMVVRLLARIARTSGFVPVDSRWLDSGYANVWRGRSLFVIARGTAGWPPLLRAVCADAVPHVVLIVGTEEPRGIGGVALHPVPSSRLVASVVPAALPASMAAHVQGVADRSCGLPMRFAERLWRLERPHELADVRRRSSRAAESRPTYGEETVIETATSLPPVTQWASPAELAILRRRANAALAMLADGRHAPGIRQLRQSVGGFARRHAWSDAAEGTLAVAAALRRRGRVNDAHTALDEARAYASRARHDVALIDIATLSGEIWIDRMRLDEAEATLAAAVASASAAGETMRSALASIALSRCLFWRGRFADAAAALPRPADDWPAIVHLKWSGTAARVHVGMADVPRAVACVADLVRRADAGLCAASRAAAACVAAFVHLAACDFDAVERYGRMAIDASRAARDPLRTLRARLTLAELERRRGNTSAAAALLGRVQTHERRLPPILAARGALLRDLIAKPDDVGGVVKRHVAGTGLGALALFADLGRTTSAARFDAIVDEIVAILHACQIADDESAILKDICARVRRQLRALSVVCVLMPTDRRESIAADGPRFEPSTLERIAAAGIVIAPHHCEGRTEAAAPIHYGGRIVGALCARWSPGSTEDLSRAPAVLTMTAAALGPVLSSACGRQVNNVPPAPELLGTTATLTALRRSVERAASAPFAVLVEGESGSGKEIVARAIHRGSQRLNRAFCTINCAALPDELVEAELFGHARGAFTGAIAERAGVFEEAHGGTLLLDEVGELSLRAQAKVLRVIQEGEIRRVGENVSRRVDVRIVAATNRDLRSEVQAGRFRLDLLYRLDVVRICVPPLRERREDIALLAEHFWRDVTARIGSRAVLSAQTIASLAQYHWPGNVRELQNVLASLAVRSPKRGVIPPTALPPQFGAAGDPVSLRLDEARRQFEDCFVRAALVRTGGHRGRAAEELGVTRQGLTKLMSRLGIGEEVVSS